MRLILASASPRRRDLLAQIGLCPDLILPTNIDETARRHELPRLYALRIAEEKALEARKQLDKDDFILSADTVVSVGRRILPKGESEEIARSCLKLLSGRRHRVETAICVLHQERKVHKIVTSIVKFKALSDHELEQYIISREWQGKAGAYAIQGLASVYISYIAGSYTNIVGLPLYETLNALKGLGYATNT